MRSGVLNVRGRPHLLRSAMLLVLRKYLQVNFYTRELIEHLHNFLRGLQNRNQTIRPSSTSAFTPVPSSSNSGFHQTANCEDDDAYIDKKEGDDDSFLRYRFPLSDREKNACHIDIDMTIVPNK
ncbi:hypothetical protein TNCV_4039463 [Trichonephila clavipes]|nr:hypothetical protein TNCV_4039463 [Trichonephila clavipes]